MKPTYDELKAAFLDLVERLDAGFDPSNLTSSAKIQAVIKALTDNEPELTKNVPIVGNLVEFDEHPAHAQNNGHVVCFGDFGYNDGRNMVLVEYFNTSFQKDMQIIFHKDDCWSVCGTFKLESAFVW